MIKHEDTSQTSIIERATDYTPPRSLSHWFIGRPLQTADAPHQTIGKAIGLAVFASDALSSTAYATQEIMVILAAAGTMAFGYVFPISLAIVALMTRLSMLIQAGAAPTLLPGTISVKRLPKSQVPLCLRTISSRWLYPLPRVLHKLHQLILSSSRIVSGCQ